MVRVTAATPHWAAGTPESRVTAPDIISLFIDACVSAPDGAALVFEDGISVSRVGLRSRVERFAGYLRERVTPGDRVAIMLENRTEFMVTWLAVLANGGILVSLNTSAGEYDAGHMLQDSGATLAVVGRGAEPLMRALQARCPELREIVLVSEPEPDGLAAFSGVDGPLDLAAVTVDPEAPTNIYYTSGTTGPPKGCVTGHRYWLRFADMYLRLYDLTPADRLLCCLQFFYGDPPWQMLVSLHARTALVVMRRFSVSRFWDVVREHDVTRLFGLASIPSLLLKAPPDARDREHRVKFALQIGVPSASQTELHERWGFPWVEGYGLSETGLVVAMPLDYGDAMEGSASIGIPCPEVEVRICDDEGNETGANQPGEITLKAPGLMQGYWNRPDATAEVFRDGWFHTGDIGRRDGRGFLFFMGRKKDIIRRSGENVAAAEVEELLRSHGAILEAAVVPVPDELRGEEVKAYVALVEGGGRENLAPDEIVAFCAQRLSKHKVPRYIEYRTDPFPRTPSMRVKKSDLLTEPRSPTAAVWDREVELGW
jgi:crotonobetaine/carnitine-CoA ligase